MPFYHLSGLISHCLDDLYLRNLSAASLIQVFELSDDTVHSMLTMTNNSNAMDIFHLTDHMSVVHQTVGNRLLQHVDKRPFDVTQFFVQIIVWKCGSKKAVICFHISCCKQNHILSHCCLIDNIHQRLWETDGLQLKKIKNGYLL